MNLTVGVGDSTLKSLRSVSQAIPILALLLNSFVFPHSSVTLKDVKKRWGQGHDDAFPVAQFEQLWGDMTVLPEVRCGFFAVPVVRGQQLKEPAQLEGWLRNGSPCWAQRAKLLKLTRRRKRGSEHAAIRWLRAAAVRWDHPPQTAAS